MGRGLQILLVAVLVFVTGAVIGAAFGFGWWVWLVFAAAAIAGITMNKRATNRARARTNKAIADIHSDGIIHDQQRGTK